MADKDIDAIIRELFYQVPGMSGTQSGPVQESPSMENARMLQALAGMGLIGGGTAAMFGAAGPLGVMGGQGAAGAGALMLGNSSEPNIRDVYADKLRQQMTRKGR